MGQPSMSETTAPLHQPRETEPELERETARAPETIEEEPPPFFGNWRNVYAFVVGELVVTIALFWALTRCAS